MKNPRTLAYSILCDVYLNGQFANLALKQRLQTRSDQDKNLITKKLAALFKVDEQKAAQLTLEELGI